MHVSSVLCHLCTAKAEDQSATTTQVDAPDREGEAHKDVRKRKSPKSVRAGGRGHSRRCQKRDRQHPSLAENEGEKHLNHLVGILKVLYIRFLWPFTNFSVFSVEKRTSL